MAGRQGGRDNERPDLAGVPEIMPRPTPRAALARRRAGGTARARASTAVWLALPLATAPRASRYCGAGFKHERHVRMGEQWKQAKASGTTGGATWPPVFEAMPR